jgi:hypothetical protein
VTETEDLKPLRPGLDVDAAQLSVPPRQAGLIVGADRDVRDRPAGNRAPKGDGRLLHQIHATVTEVQRCQHIVILPGRSRLG